MPAKGGNAKKEAGRAKKAENENKKKEKAAADKEAVEASKWADSESKGAKSAARKAEQEDKRKAELARKAENAKLLAEEEAGAAKSVKAAPKAGQKKTTAVSKPTPKPAGPGAIAAGGGLGAVSASASGNGSEKGKEEEELVQSFAVTGIDNAIDLLETINAKTDKASVGQQAAGLERHPERRFKAAFEAYKERELPNVKNDYPGLRLNQYQEMLFKQFQKHPDNPFNQVTVAYDASKEEKVEALKTKKAQVEESMRDRS